MIFENILAKSSLYGSITLFDHISHVIACIDKMARFFKSEFDLLIARKGAVLHDLGKIHPYFQEIIRCESLLLLTITDSSYLHRHEITSLAFLPCFPKKEWPYLIDMVVAHHKSIYNDSRNRGILDIKSNDRNWIHNHLGKWDDLYQVGKVFLELFGYQCPDIVTEQEAIDALLYTVKYCEAKKSGWAAWRGLLKAADHFASAFGPKTSIALQHTFECPDLSFYHNPKRKHILYPLSLIDASDGRKHTLVVAPTGSAKTDFMVRRTRERIFYVLPFQASINIMWARFKETVPNKDIRLLHAASKVVPGQKNTDEQILQPLAGSSIKVLTPYQLAAIIFGTTGYESVILDVQGCDVILDEVHTYSAQSGSILLEIVKVLKHLGCRIHIGTATIPSVLYKKLLHILGGKQAVYEVKLPKNELSRFNRHRIFKMESENDMYPLLKSVFAANDEKVLIVVNSINKAQKVFERVSQLFPDIPKLLIHGRFKRGDRFQKELQLKEEFSRDPNKLDMSPCIVVATQVVEVSLDISFDRMITACAPLANLIQRFGRVNRIRNENTIGQLKPIHVIKPSGNVLPYERGILKKSFAELPDNGDALQEKDLQQKIDNIYPVLDSAPIDFHLKFINNKFLLKQLTDNKRSILMDTLTAEAATCILESDKQQYLDGDWFQRIDLEIPVDWKTIARFKKQYEQLPIGSHPFIIPQSVEAYEKYGLQLTEHPQFS